MPLLNCQLRWNLSFVAGRMYLSGLLLFLSACFRMGLPEAVGGVNVLAAANATLPLPEQHYSSLLTRSGGFVLLGTGAFVDSQRGASLGHQYLFGFVPLTRVFLEHGPEEFILEVFIKRFLEEGYRILVVPQERLAGVDIQAPLRAVLSITTKNVAINAFDALFFRIARVSGEIAVGHYSLDRRKQLKYEVFEMNETQYRRQAQAPVLSAILERRIRDIAEFSASKLLNHRLGRFFGDPSVPTSPLAQPLWLVLPHFQRPPAPGMGAYLSKSYGFASVPPMGTSEILRLVQRGIGQELYDRQLPTISVLDEGEDLTFGHCLRSVVQRLEVDEKSNTSLEIRFREEDHGELIREGTCVVEMPLSREADGSAIVSLEKASALAVSKFLLSHESSGNVHVDCAQD